MPQKRAGVAPPGRKLLFVASECYPLIKTGGLADVVGALPLALAAGGDDVRVALPAFPAVKKAAVKRKKLAEIADLFGGPATLYSAEAATGLKLFLIDAPHFFDIEGNPYQDKAGDDRADNHLRYAALSYAAAQLAAGDLTDWRADIVHAHDWQAGLTATYLQQLGAGDIGTVLTIHNLAFQGLFPKTVLTALKLEASQFHQDGLEYWGKISFLKAGIVASDQVTTVSPTYAAEIQTEDGGMGLGGLLKSRNDNLSGILNGIDTAIWDPATDATLPASYDREKLGGKAACKKAIQKEFGLKTDAKAPLFCVVSRLTEQKGLDVLADCIPHIVGNYAQLIILGSGDKDLEAGFKQAAKDHPDQVGVFIGYDEPLAHRLQAGADAIFIPSRFEPCGLTQLCAMRYGTLPIVSRVGGLADTVIDANEAALQVGAGTGLQFSPVSKDALYSVIDRTLRLFGDKKAWRKAQKNAMKHDVSWAGPAQGYSQIYDRLLGR